MSLSTGNVITVDSWLDLKAENRRLRGALRWILLQTEAELERIEKDGGLAVFALRIESATRKALL
jgi:hypothetical protein